MQYVHGQPYHQCCSDWQYRWIMYFGLNGRSMIYQSLGIVWVLMKWQDTNNQWLKMRMLLTGWIGWWEDHSVIETINFAAVLTIPSASLLGSCLRSSYHMSLIMCCLILDKQTTLHQPSTSLKNVSSPYFSCSLRLIERVQYTSSDSVMNCNWVWSSSRVYNFFSTSIHSQKVLNPLEYFLGLPGAIVFVFTFRLKMLPHILW